MSTTEQIEVRRVEIVGRDLAKLIETLKRPPSGAELGEWLEEHQQVTDLAASTAILEDLINRHLVDQDVAATATAARNPELERQIREDPANSAPYLVYADWLQEHTDPVGELIALGVASASGRPWPCRPRMRARRPAGSSSASPSDRSVPCPSSVSALVTVRRSDLPW